MAVSNWAPFDILAGPADVYIAATSTAFPAVNAAPGGSWTSLGETEGGVTVRHRQTLVDITTDQHIATLKSVRSEEGLELEFSLASITLENYSYAMNSITGVTAAGGPPAIKTLGLTRGVQPQLNSMLIRGRSPYGNFNAQYEVPIVVQHAEPEIQHVKDNNVLLHCQFNAMADLTQSASQLFGRLIAQTS